MLSMLICPKYVWDCALFPGSILEQKLKVGVSKDELLDYIGKRLARYEDIDDVTKDERAFNQALTRWREVLGSP